MFKLALIQMRVIGGNPDANRARALELIAEAAKNGANVCLLPETFNLGWTHASAATLAETVPGGESCRALQSAAREFRIYICGGLVERAGAELFNSAVLIDPQGELLIRYRKLNELEIGQEFYAGGAELRVVKTPLANFGVMICSDGFAKGEVISRTLGLMGADVILSPGAWAVPPEHNNAREPYGTLWAQSYGGAARDFQMWIAGVSNVGVIDGGPWNGWHCIGCSLVVNPDGKQELKGPFGVAAESILYADLSPVPRPARGEGWKRVWASQ